MTTNQEGKSINTSEATSNLNIKKQEIDESLYSRTLYVLGHDTMKKMASSKVLIIGLSGLGLEIAKNIVLSGVNNVVFSDDEFISEFDIGTNFYLNNDSIFLKSSMITRADFLKSKIAELNPNATIVSISQKKLNESYFIEKEFTVVVVVNQSLTETLMYSRWCRNNSIKFIQTSSFGLFANCFVDFGESFMVNDKNGEELSRSIINKDRIELEYDPSSINVKMRTHLDQRSSHKLQDGDRVCFNPSIFPIDFDQYEMLGPIKVINTHCIEIPILDTTGLFDFEILKGNLENIELIQVIHPTTFKSKSFEEAIMDWSSQFNNCADFLLMENIPALHASYLYLTEREKENIPEDFNKFVNEVRATANSFGYINNLNCNTLALIHHTFEGEVGPINSVMGGFVAQEVLKLCGHKFTPLHGWLYLDFHNILNKSQVEKILQQVIQRKNGKEELNIVKPLRLKKLVNAVGVELVEKLTETNIFMIGSGAIGCEHLKNFAILDIATSPNSTLTITDMDTIEKSNLSRQFLFRPQHVGMNKAIVARESVLKMNPKMNIIAHQNLVSEKTEEIYSNNFLQKQAAIVNALDNIEARLYMDSRCVDTQRALFESGTLGTKGNTQVILPFLTESYSASHDPPEELVPQCTLKNFPHKIEHTIAYARNLFEGLFIKSIEIVKGYISDPDYYFDKLSSQYEQEEAVDIIKNVLQIYYPSTFTDCIRWALSIWMSQFRNQIIQLITSHPKDQLTTEGVPFWNGTKKFPHPHNFDSTNQLHMDFIVATSNLLAKIFKVTPSKFTDRVVIARVVNQELSYLPQFIPDKHLVIPGNDEEIKKMREKGNCNVVFDLQKERKQLPSVTSENLQKLYDNIDSFVPEKFEKDDPANFHIDFITAASNLRASNYGIETISKFETKKIAGKIIPAIATTTSIVSGLVSIELMKYINGICDITKYRNFFLNLAIPMVTSSKPDPPEYQNINGKKYSYWDNIEMDANLTVEQIINHITNTFDIDVDMINKGDKCLYSNFFGSKEKREKKKKMTLFQIAKEIALSKDEIKTEFFKSDSPTKNEFYEVFMSRTPDDPDEEIENYVIKLCLKS